MRRDEMKWKAYVQVDRRKKCSAVNYTPLCVSLYYILGVDLTKANKWGKIYKSHMSKDNDFSNFDL